MGAFNGLMYFICRFQWPSGRSLSGTACSNPAGGMNACRVVNVIRAGRSLGQADPSSRGVLPNVVCLTECD